MDLRSFYEPLLEIVTKASTAILKIYEDPSRFEVATKSDDSPLTAADRASNDIICEALSRLDSIPIISEENKQLPYETRAEYEYCWLVDPLDGTKEFVKRNGEFTINIALVRQGKVVLGAMHVPVSGLSYIASENDGAFRIENGVRSNIQCRSFNQSDTNLGVVCSRSHLSESTQDYVRQFNDPLLVPRGSALKFTVIAEGNADLYPRLGPTMEWDTAAAQIILELAGGHLLDFESRMPLRYNKEDLLNPSFVAYGNGDLHV